MCIECQTSSMLTLASTFQSPVDLSSDDEAEVVDEKLDKTEAELKKISTGMGKVRGDRKSSHH